MTNRLAQLLIVLIVSSFLAGCWYGPDNNPKAVTLKFLATVQKGEYDKAMEMATDDQKLLINMDKMAFARLSKDDQQKELAVRATQIVTITNFDEAKETARVYCSFNGKVPETLNLFKKDGKWLVSGW